ncbi:hypothetical protein IIA15_00220, partial [candidate division TA06 bacterium]|nr:hypothetical protein [candidate division TA06 bacterium]
CGLCETRTRSVPGEGPDHPEILFIGEGPGFHEDQQGRPFVGPAGIKQMIQWEEVGLKRSDFYITNVCPRQPPKNKIEAIPKEELAVWVGKLHERLAELTDPWLIVPTGNTALKALIGKAGITKFRGSILSYDFINAEGATIPDVKVIPTLHPSYILRDPSMKPRWALDWQRIADESKFRGIHLPEREHFIDPTISDIQDFSKEIAGSEMFSIDIETNPATGDLLCIGFSSDPLFSFTIPTTLTYWGDETTLDLIYSYIEDICGSPPEKVLQNGFYDAYWLLMKRGIRIENFKWDLLCMHHCLDSKAAHSLAYMASIYTKQPYWKDMGRDYKVIEEWGGADRALWAYCGLDNCVQVELAEIFKSKLEEKGKLQFYLDKYTALFDSTLGLMVHGIGVNSKKRSIRFTRNLADCITIQDKLEVLAGEKLHAKKDLSSKRVQKFLYETLKIPKVISRKTGKATADEVAIRRLVLRHPKKAKIPGELILEHRRKKKLTEFLEETRSDEDGRIRCSYGLTTNTLRFKSSKNPMNGGANLQNQDREIRDIFIPDLGCILLEGDLSQAESRRVYAYTGDEKLIELARTMPWEYDGHRDNASLIYGITAEKVTKKQRYLGKKAAHAGHYGMHGFTLSDELLKDGDVYTPKECQTLIDSYLDARMPIRGWQKETRMEILRNRILANAFGWDISFKYDLLNDKIFREGYAFRPQSDVAMILNLWGLIPVFEFLKFLDPRCKVNLQVHDSLVISTPPEFAYSIASYMRKSLERNLPCNGVDLTIPVEFKLGSSWKFELEYKRLPSKKEFTEAAHSMMRKDEPMFSGKEDSVFQSQRDWTQK